MTTYQLPRLRLARLSDAVVYVCTLEYIPEVFLTSIRRKCVRVVMCDIIRRTSNYRNLKISYLAIFSRYIVATNYLENNRGFKEIYTYMYTDTQKIFAITN